ncbi:hypothetical protein E2C01_023433 [Portunus trituberculatus]|uniref:Uncharacterized protein n=1 Tax=Portunus trituberculatus TaxID=210409 RepID=A0A5B7EBK1_PORTR|nr:hypothetical protein [Portunus trituberculatus]
MCVCVCVCVFNCFLFSGQGWRAPFLELGGDEMFSALQQLGLKYDCSWTTLKYTNWFEKPNQGLWPYTLDYNSPQDCPLGRCPKDTYPGVWVMPMLDLNDNKNQPCAMLDTCQRFASSDTHIAVETEHMHCSYLLITDLAPVGHVNAKEWLALQHTPEIIQCVFIL